ncbi:integrase, catalytic region, zinc finger, CCHC-type containing protein [Tanacetum coccineum]
MRTHSSSDTITLQSITTTSSFPPPFHITFSNTNNLKRKFPHIGLVSLFPMCSARQGDPIKDQQSNGLCLLLHQIQGRQSQSYARTGNRGNATTSKGNYASGQPRVVKCYNCQGEGNMARQCTQPKRPRNTEWFKEKLMLAEAQEADLDTHDSDGDDLSSVKAVLMANLSSCDPDVLSEVPYTDSYPNDMLNQNVQKMTYSKHTHIVDFPDNEINSDSNIIPYSQYLQEKQDGGIQDTNSSTPNDLLVLSLV